MKKRLFALAMAVIFIVTVLLSFTSCENNGGYAEKYSYSSCYINDTITTEFDTLDETIEFVYSDTYLKLYDDGKWVIDSPLFLSYSMNIDEGTYEVDGDEYTFSGFEYGMKSVGYKSDDGFKIVFKVPDGKDYVTAMTLTYKK